MGREIGYTAWRDRVLTPVTTIHLFLLQMLHGNTACSHLPYLSGIRFSAAAYGQARARLPWRCFDLLLERFGSAVQRSALDDGRWHGHRTFLVDGASCSMPDMLAPQDVFGQSTEQRPGCGVPVAHLLGLFHAGTGVLLKLVVAPLLTHDLAQVQAVHPSSEDPQAQLSRLNKALHEVFALERSKKHLVQRQLGRFEPTLYLKYRASEVMRNMPALST